MTRSSDKPELTAEEREAFIQAVSKTTPVQLRKGLNAWEGRDFLNVWFASKSYYARPCGTCGHPRHDHFDAGDVPTFCCDGCSAFNPESFTRPADERQSLERELEAALKEASFPVDMMSEQMAFVAGYDAGWQARDAEIERLREALREIADDGEFEVDPRYDWDAAHDANRHVQIAREALKEAEKE